MKIIKQNILIEKRYRKSLLISICVVKFYLTERKEENSLTWLLLSDKGDTEHVCSLYESIRDECKME